MVQQSLSQRVAEEYLLVPGYLDTAAVGLPTRRSLAVMRRRLREWEAGTAAPQSFDPDVTRARASFARLAGVDQSAVGIATALSPVTGMVAASLPDGAAVLCAEEDFASVLFPFLADPRLEVTTVPLSSLTEQIDDRFDLVAVSAAQSSTGAVTDLDALHTAARDHGVRTFVDTTQAAGWLPIGAERFDVTACHGYKWLCAPRGAAFLTVNPRGQEWLRPINAGWYAGEEPWSSIYGPPLRLASDARKYDTSPPWFSFAAAAPALEFLADLGVERVGDHAIGLANRFRGQLGIEPSNSPIVSVDVDAEGEFERAGIKTSARAGKARFSFYLYNTDEDVERAAAVVRQSWGR